MAWKGVSAVYLSFDVDSVDAGFGSGHRKAVEVSPPYDISDITALVAVRAMVDVLATMVKHGRVGGKLA